MSEQQPYLSVLVDGYVSGCHGPQQAERYFKCLLKSDTISASHHSGREGDSFIVTSVPPHIRSQRPNQYAWVLDRKVMDAGSVVPQTLWTPHSITDRRHHVDMAELQMPIFFMHTDGRLGLPLEAAVAGHCHNLAMAQIPAPLGPPATAHIRIGWPGYSEYRRQVHIRDETGQRNTVTLSKFAQHVGQSVRAFIENRQVDPGNHVPRWSIGGRGQGIQPEEIVIIGAIHVSSGSWMPILQLTRYIF